jgi:hypothetical protein
LCFKPTSDRIANFSLSSAHTDNPRNLNQTPGYNEYIPVEKISALPPNTSEHMRPKSRREQ